MCLVSRWRWIHRRLFKSAWKNRIVLAANSNYFHAMFSAGMKESNKEVIELRDERISPDALSVVQQCCDFLKREFIQLRLDLRNYCLLTTVAYRHSLGDLPATEAVEHKMASMFKDICESEEFLTRHIGAKRAIIEPPQSRWPQCTFRDVRL